MPPSNWLVFDRIREFARSNRIFQQERILQDQSAIDRITVGGEFLNFSSQSAILEQTNLQINRLERYKDYEQMDQTGEVSLALDLYADECSLIDPEHKHALIIRADDRKIKQELEELFYETLLTDRVIRPAVRYLCKFGDCPYEIVTDQNRSGVSSLRFMNVYNFTRIETRFGDLIGFFYQDDIYPEPIFLHPWACMHLRLTSLENIYHPYGRGVLDGGRKAFKQLRLMEDAALIYRITRAPEKRKYKIPVGLIPPKEVPEYMQMIARMFKRQRFYNPTTGTFDERYSPMVQEDDFFLPQRPDGSGPDIEVLPGAENLDQIADIEYFKKKMIAPMKIPFSRVGIGEGAGEPNEKSLSQSHAEFAKAVKWVQAETSLGLTKVGIVHLALRGYPVSALRGFELHLAASSAIEDLYRMETWQTRTAVMAELKDIGWFPKEWIVTRFTDLSPDEIEELEEMEDKESGGGIGGGGGGALLGGPEEEEGAMAPGDLGGELPEAEEEEEPFPPEEMESLQDARDKNLLVEIRRDEQKVQSADYVRRLYNKKNAVTTPCFSHILEQKELDGLSKGTPPTKEGVLAESEKSESQEVVLVEWSVPPETRKEAIEEVATVLRGAAVQISDSGEITDADLPAQQCSN